MQDINNGTAPVPEKKRKLIEATVRRMLVQGFAATSVDEICADAGVTKGSFFYYFASKEDICRAAMDTWAGWWVGILQAVNFNQIADPLDRIERLFVVMEETYLNPNAGAGCLIGTVAQEVASSNRNLGDCCEEHLNGWAEIVRQMLAEAKLAHPPKTEFDPASVAGMMLSLAQGSLLIAKTRQDRQIIRDNLQHCRAYINTLFGKDISPTEETQ